LLSDLKIQGGAEPGVMVIDNPKSGEKLFLFAGRQVVTAERIEVLASLSDAPIDDGLSAEKVIDKVLDIGGMPIVSWAPGKWLFKRHAVVARLLARYGPGQLLLGDTTLRPVGSQQPRLMKKGDATGFGLVAGSDPLPFAGEERRLGSYAILIEGTFQRALPVSSMRNLFRSTPLKSRFVGRRNHHFEAGQRLVNNMIVKRQGSSRPSKGLSRPSKGAIPMGDTPCHIPPGTRVLVTGATGFTGAVVARKLIETGVEVNAIARQSSNLAPLSDLEINWFRGDVGDEALVASAAADIDYIFHIAAAFREAKSSEADYRRIHVTSTQHLVRQALKNPDFKRYVHISTIGVHGHIEDPGADETYRFSPGDGYQRTKAEAEKWLQAFAQESGLPFTIIRPAAIYGPGDRRLLKLFKMAKWPVFPLLGKGKCYYHLIHVDDLSNAIILAATAPAAEGETFIIGNKHPIPIAEIAKIVGRELGREIKVVRMPVEPFFAVADACEALCRPLKIEPPIYRRRVAFYTKDRMFNTEKMRNTLGYETRHTNQDGIAETAQWYLRQGWLKK
jgi:nucleoside-diphosphate-sugar epimerase